MKYCSQSGYLNNLNTYLYIYSFTYKYLFNFNFILFMIFLCDSEDILLIRLKLIRLKEFRFQINR